MKTIEERLAKLAQASPKKLRELLVLKHGSLNIPIPDGKERLGPVTIRQFLARNFIIKKFPKCAMCKTEPVILTASLKFTRCCSNHCSARLALSEASEKIKREHGVSNVSQLDSIKKKKIETCRKNFGVDHPQQSKRVRKKSVASVRERYGVDNVSQAKKIKAKRNATFEEKFGGNPFSSPYVKEKIKNYWEENYGVAHPMHVPEIAERQRKTLRKTLGVDYPSQSAKVRAKMRRTCRSRYGVSNPSQSEAIFNKQQHNSMRGRWENYGTVSLHQRGYEAQVASALYESGHAIKTLRNCPEIWYWYKGKRHRYFPDFGVVHRKSKRRIVVEVKSTYSLGLNHPDTYSKNQKKFKAILRTLDGTDVKFYVCLYMEKRGLIWIKEPVQSRKDLLAFLLREHEIAWG